MMLILRRNIKKWLEEGFNLTLINDPDVAKQNFNLSPNFEPLLLLCH